MKVNYMNYKKDITFDLYNKDKRIAHVELKGNDVKVINYNNSRIFNPFLIPCVTRATVINFLENRCFEITRPDKQELLNRMGLEYYDVIDIVKKTHGMMAEDLSWLKFEDEDISYEELFNR